MNKIAHLLRTWNVGSTLMLILLVGIWSTPTLGLLITSLRPSSVAEVSPWWEALFNPLATAWTIDAYQTSLNSGMLSSLINTIAVTIPATVLPLMIAANAAYAFTFLDFKGKEIFLLNPGGIDGHPRAVVTDPGTQRHGVGPAYIRYSADRDVRQRMAGP
jgi:alpha-glucoside transport system permease protein